MGGLSQTMSSQNRQFLPTTPLVVVFIKYLGLCSKLSLGLPPLPYRDDIHYGRPHAFITFLLQKVTL